MRADCARDRWTGPENGQPDPLRARGPRKNQPVSRSAYGRVKLAHATSPRNFPDRSATWQCPMVFGGGHPCGRITRTGSPGTSVVFGSIRSIKAGR